MNERVNDCMEIKDITEGWVLSVTPSDNGTEIIVRKDIPDNILERIQKVADDEGHMYIVKESES